MEAYEARAWQAWAAGLTAAAGVAGTVFYAAMLRAQDVVIRDSPRTVFFIGWLFAATLLAAAGGAVRPRTATWLLRAAAAMFLAFALVALLSIGIFFFIPGGLACWAAVSAARATKT